VLVAEARAAARHRVIAHAAVTPGFRWIIATFARCQQILAVDAPLPVRRRGAAAFRAAVDDLLGPRDLEGIRDRADAVRALLPELRRAAASIMASPGDQPGY
jgi:hypothetical protein